MSNGNWRIINSWWILLTLPPMGLLSWAAFIYIGFKVKQRKWIIWGFVYSFAIVGYMMIGSDPSLEYFILIPDDSWILTLSYSIETILWIASIIHAFKIRDEYLIRLETLKKYKCSNEDILRKEIENEFKQNNISNQRPIQKANNIPHSVPKDNAPKTEPELVDINNDSEQAISELPGIGIILAKKAIEIRETRDFESADDFGQSLDLKPHIIEHIRPFVLINPSNRIFDPVESGRRVDF